VSCGIHWPAHKPHHYFAAGFSSSFEIQRSKVASLAGQLFDSEPMPVGLGFLAKNKTGHAKRSFRDRRKQTLFIEAGTLAVLRSTLLSKLLSGELQLNT
jgi:hypothetical protein